MELKQPASLFMGDMLESYYRCGINERRIRACFHGWVILSDHLDRVWSLWNPRTSKLIDLPARFGTYHACCLSSPPGDPGSVFLLLSEAIPNIVFCRLDRKIIKWTEESYAEQIRSISGADDRILECPTCCNGKVYAMTLGPYHRFVTEVDIVVKDSKNAVISLKPIVKVPDAPSHTVYSFLKGCGTELFYIEIGFKDGMTIAEVRLFKLDMIGMMWEELKDLKDATFFLELSSYSVFFKSAVASQIRGCVHVLGLKNKIISFHVKDRTMSLSPMPYMTRESQVLLWAMLECRLEAKKEKDIEVVIRSVTRDETEFDNKRSESTLLNVPFHILQMISERCSPAEIQSFRATCKSCYLASLCYLAAPLWTRQMYSPWLVVLNNYQGPHGTITFIDPICDKEYIKETPLKLKGACQILCSRYGWLLMSKFPGWELVFFNPFIGKIRRLPKVPDSFESICFSEPPTSPDCMVVAFTTHGPVHVYIHFVSRDLSWHGYRLDFGTNNPYSFHLPTFSGQDIYALCNNGRIAIFRDIGKEDYSWEVVKDKAPRSCCKPRSKLFLSKCDQHLLLVIVSEFGESIEVFKLNDSTKEWEKIDGLRNHMIYISGSSCVCLEAKLPQMRNKIYFPRFLHKYRKMQVFYSLETCRYHTFDNKIIQESFGASLHGTTHHCGPHTWIENGCF